MSKESEFQADVGRVLRDLNELIAKRQNMRGLLQQTRDAVHDLTVDGTIGNRSAVEYLLCQSRILADLALEFHDDRIEDLVKQRDDLAAATITRN